MAERLLGGFVEGRRCRVGGGHGVLTLPGLHRVVLLPIIVGIEELLEPLDELKVVLELPLHQFVYWDDLETHRGGIRYYNLFKLNQAANEIFLATGRQQRDYTAEALYFGAKTS